MRITNKKYNTRPSKIKEVNKKIFLAFEGLNTEKNYFHSLLATVNNKFISPLYFYREKNSGLSNPLSIVNEIIKDMYEEPDCCPTYEMIFLIISDYCKEKNIPLSDSKIKSLVAKFANKYSHRLNDKIAKNQISDLLEEINNKVGNLTLTESVLNLDLINIIEFYYSFDKNIDSIFVICDRDKDSFSEVQYDKVVQICKDIGIELIISNPCIEFWFLLHHTDCSELNYSDIYENKKSNNETFVYNMLKTYNPRYSKDMLNFEFYCNNVNVAIENSKVFETTVDKLKYNIGTMIPLFLKKIKLNT